MSVLFSPLVLRTVTLPNRVAMAPMCQYSAGPAGCRPTGTGCTSARAPSAGPA